MKLVKKLSAICVALIATISLSICTPPVYAATATATKGSVTAKVLNVRSGPAKTYKKVGTLKKGSSVTILSTKAGWKKVSYKGRTGYVYSKFIKVK